MHTSLLPTNCTTRFNAPSCFGCKHEPFSVGSANRMRKPAILALQ